MSLQNKLAVVLISFAAITLAGCTSFNDQAVAPASGAFNNSNLSGTYVVAFSGTDNGNGNPLSAVGSFTLDGNGNVISGIEDLNDNGNSSNLQALPIQGAVLLGSPGSAQLRTTAPGLGTLHFDVWAIDSTHLKFVEVGICLTQVGPTGCGFTLDFASG